VVTVLCISTWKNYGILNFMVKNYGILEFCRKRKKNYFLA